MGWNEDGTWSGPGYRDLIAWQKALDPADLVYDACAGWPKDEVYGLAGQAKRAAVSIPANIAEGHGRGTPRDFARFLAIAYGSLCELETLIFMAHRRRFIDQSTRDRLIARSTEVARIVHGLMRSARRRASATLREEEEPYDDPFPADPDDPNA